MNIINLKTNYLVNPKGLADFSPSFSWNYQGTENFVQKAYRIVVSTSKEGAERLIGDAWDSGEVVSRRTSAIEYAGEPLRSRSVYYWRVVADGTVSDIATFETGLMREEDFLARWVSAPVTRMGEALYIRKDFQIPEGRKVVRARAYIAGLGCHEFYVNGKKIGKGILSPSVTDYNERVFYCVYPFEEEILDGNNALGVFLGHGWLGARKLLAQVHILLDNGEEIAFYTNTCSDWWVLGSPIKNDSIYDGEIYDGRVAAETKDWCNPAVQADWMTGWLYVNLCERPQGKLLPQTLPEIEEIRAYSPVKTTQMQEGVTVYDLGQIIAGYARIKVKGVRGAKVTLCYGEQIDERGYVDQLNLRTALARDIYILAGEGEETYAPRFTYHGFQYVQAVVEGEGEIVGLEGIYIRNAVAQTSSFWCNDEIVNRLHENAVITEGCNMHGVMTDCPQRDERFGWLNDLSSRIYQSVLNYDLSSFIPKVVEDISDAQDEEGKIGDTAPFMTGFRPADPVSLCYLSFGDVGYRVYGNEKLLRKEYANYRKWVDFLTSKVGDDGATLYHCYADWCPPEQKFGDADPSAKETPGDFVSIVYYCLHLRTLAKISRDLGKEKEGAEYARLAEATKAAIVKKYYHADKNTFASGSQPCLGLALSLGLVEGEKATAMAKALNDNIVARGYHIIAGNQSYVHIFKVLTEYGYADTVHKVLVNPEYPGWGYMLAQGATTVWERWEKEIHQKMHSYCHPMFASYDAWLISCMAGIQPALDAKGADKLLIKPVPMQGIDRLKASWTCVTGKVEVELESAKNERIYTVAIPANVDAEIILPNILSVNGEKGERKSVCCQGGGKYTIVTRR